MGQRRRRAVVARMHIHGLSDSDSRKIGSCETSLRIVNLFEHRVIFPNVPLKKFSGLGTVRTFGAHLSSIYSVSIMVRLDSIPEYAEHFLKICRTFSQNMPSIFSKCRAFLQ